MGQVVVWVWIHGDWWVTNVTDDRLLKIADDRLDVVCRWRHWWRRWSGGAIGQMVSSIWVLCGFCVCFAVRHGLIFIFWVQMGWMWQWSGGFFFFFPLICDFGSSGILVGSGHGGGGRHGGGGVVMTGLFGCWERDKNSER